MISSFRNYLVEEEKSVYFTFGRLNPPTEGHGLLMNTLSSKSGSNPYRIYLSRSTDNKKNPLGYESKVKFVRKMFPKHSRSVILDQKINTVFDAVVSLYNEGFLTISMVVGSDRVSEFEILLKKYNGVKGRHGFYNFKRINVISAGERDPDSETVSGISASKQRESASNNDFTAFSQGLPKLMTNADARSLFNAVRKGMGLSESTDFRKTVDLGPISESREQYVKGDLFKEGDRVVIKKTSEIGTIVSLGSNYLVIESSGRKLRKWIDDVELLETKTPHRLDPNLSLKHALKHTKLYQDLDLDGDVDEYDRKKVIPDEITGVEGLQKRANKKMAGEKSDARKKIAYESTIGSIFIRDRILNSISRGKL